MTTNTPAKINLCLDIIRKRADGYHELDMIMHEIPLYDIVTVEKSDGISLTCDIPDIPCDHTNIACKALSRSGLENGVTEVGSTLLYSFEC